MRLNPANIPAKRKTQFQPSRSHAQLAITLPINTRYHRQTRMQNKTSLSVLRLSVLQRPRFTSTCVSNTRNQTVNKVNKAQPGRRNRIESVPSARQAKTDRERQNLECRCGPHRPPLHRRQMVRARGGALPNCAPSSSCCSSKDKQAACQDKERCKKKRN